MSVEVKGCGIEVAVLSSGSWHHDRDSQAETRQAQAQLTGSLISVSNHLVEILKDREVGGLKPGAALVFSWVKREY